MCLDGGRRAGRHRLRGAEHGDIRRIGSEQTQPDPEPIQPDPVPEYNFRG